MLNLFSTTEIYRYIFHFHYLSFSFFTFIHGYFCIYIEAPSSSTALEFLHLKNREIVVLNSYVCVYLYRYIYVHEDRDVTEK